MPDTKKIILLVSSNVPAERSESKALERHGFKVVTARSGKAAVDVSRSNPPVDLILMDIDLGGGMDGADTAHVILGERDIPVVFLSGRIESEAFKKTEKITSYGFVVRDSGETALLASIHTAFRLHQAHRRLVESEERYRILVESSPAAILIHDYGIVLYGNQAAASAFGAASLDEYIGRNAIEAVHPDDREMVSGRMVRMMETGEPAPLVLERFVGLDGRDIYMQVAGSRIIWEGKPALQMIGVDVTASTLAERKVHEAEERQRAFINASSDMAFIKDDGFKYLMVNRAFEEFLDRPEAEIIGKTDYDLMPHEMAVGCHTSDKQALNDNRLFISCESVGERTYETRKFPVALGSIRGVGGIIRDITEIRRVSEYKQAVFDATGDAIFVDDADTGRVIDVNRSMCEMYGYTYEEALRTSIEDLSRGLPPYSQAEALEWLGKARKTGPQTFEWLAKKKDGTLFPVEVNIRFAVLGGQNRFVVVVRDITGRKRDEKALRESEEKYALIANNVADTISILDLELRFVFLSPSILRLRGFTVEEALKQTIDQVLTPESLKTAARVLREELERENDVTADPARTRTMELEEYHKNGSTIWISNSISFLRGADGRPHSLLAVSRDITERIRAQQALEEALTENRTLLHELRHRIKNSIAMIAGMVGLEAGRAASSETREALADMRNRIISLAHLYDMIHMTGDSNTVRLDDYIHRIVSSLSDTIVYDRERIAITAECDDTSIDAQRAALLGLILNELVTNAIKHAFPDGRSGAVRIESRGGGDEILLSVSDNGVGPGDSLEPGKPEGLGMKLVNLLTRQMKGELGFTGEGGTIFSVRVPRNR